MAFSKRIRYSLVAVGLAGSSLFMVPSAYAATADHEFDGYRTPNFSSTEVDSASVQIERTNTAYINGTVSINPLPASNAWDMIDNGTEYAQTGFIEYQNTGVYYFFEENDGVNDYQIYSNGAVGGAGQPLPNLSGAVGPAVDYYHTYNVSKSGDSYTGNVDGAFSNYFYVTPQYSWTPNRAEYMEEIVWDSYAQFFGTKADPTVFRYASWTDSTGATRYDSMSYYANNTTIAGNDGSYNIGTSSNVWYPYDTRA